MEALTKPRPLFFPLLDNSGDDDVDKSDRPAGRPSDRPSNPSPCESLACWEKKAVIGCSITEFSNNFPSAFPLHFTVRHYHSSPLTRCGQSSVWICFGRLILWASRLQLFSVDVPSSRFRICFVIVLLCYYIWHANHWNCSIFEIIMGRIPSKSLLLLPDLRIIAFSTVNYSFQRPVSKKTIARLHHLLVSCRERLTNLLTPLPLPCAVLYTTCQKK